MTAHWLPAEGQAFTTTTRSCRRLAGHTPGYYRSIARKAAALLQSIATNHAFSDGNKRTSILLTDLLLDRSGYRLEPINVSEDLEYALEEFVVETVVKGRATADAITAWLEPRIVRKRGRKS